MFIVPGVEDWGQWHQATAGASACSEDRDKFFSKLNRSSTFQHERCVKAKFHYTGPIGPALTRTDFVGDPHGPTEFLGDPGRSGPCGSARVRVVEFSYNGRWRNVSLTGVEVERRCVAREAAGVVHVRLVVTLLLCVRRAPRRTVAVLTPCSHTHTHTHRGPDLHNILRFIVTLS